MRGKIYISSFILFVFMLELDCKVGYRYET